MARKILLTLKLILIPVIIFLAIKGFLVSGRLYDYEHGYVKSALVVVDVKHYGEGYMTSMKYKVADQVLDKTYTFDEKYEIGKYFEIYVNPTQFTDIVIADTVPKNGLNYVKWAVGLIIFEALLISISRELKKQGKEEKSGKSEIEEFLDSQENIDN